jgi:hypothetical protein
MVGDLIFDIISEDFSTYQLLPSSSKYYLTVIAILGHSPPLRTGRMSSVDNQRPFPCFRYTSTALRMYVLLGISPRTLSILCNIDLGRVIPTFSVLSTAIVPFIPVLYIALPRIKHIDDQRPKGLSYALTLMSYTLH